MPSGAKKRKAARKKKEQQENNIKGDDDLKSQDERGSDGGESNSPAHHDEHGDQDHPFNDGSEEVEEGGDPSAAEQFASDVNSVEEVAGDVKIDEVLVEKEDGVVVVERDFESEESSERKIETFEHSETAEEPYYENRNTGGGASNGESLADENSKEKDDAYHSFEGEVAGHEVVKSSDSSPSKLTLITESEKTGNSAAEYPVNSVKAAASVSEAENGDAGSRSELLEKSVVPPLEVTNVAVKVNEDAYPLSDENAATSSLEEPKPKEYDSEVLTSSSASPVTGFTNGAKHKNSESPPSEDQLHVTSAPNIVQKTSWLSCCGLFEALSGSNR